MLIVLFCLFCVSHALFKLSFLAFQLLSKRFSAGSMFVFHSLFLAFLLQTVHTFFSFSILFFLHSLSIHPTLFEFLLIISAAFTPSINSSTEFHTYTYHLKLFSSILIHLSQLINPFTPISLLRYTLSKSVWGCKAPCIIINFLVILSKLFNPSVFYFRIPAPYLITKTTQVLTATVLLPFNFDLNITFNRRRYSLLNFFLIFSL